MDGHQPSKLFCVGSNPIRGTCVFCQRSAVPLGTAQGGPVNGLGGI